MQCFPIVILTNFGVLNSHAVKTTDNWDYTFQAKSYSRIIQINKRILKIHFSWIGTFDEMIQGVFFDWSPQKSLSIEILNENT